ncbi:MAG: hypothetical protein WCI03_12260 [bacterium]|jgi:hypothetical protein
MKNPRQIAFWMILIVSVILSIWWIFYVPYRPDRVFDAIPAGTSWVSVHQNLAGDWDALVNNPLLSRVFKAAETNEGAMAALRTNEVARKWITKLTSAQTVVAYSPAMGSMQKPALIAASWIGTQSRLLRWQMAWIKTRELTPVYLDNGNLTIWMSHEKIGKSNMRLSLALSEGLILACVSEDPIGVRTLLESAEHYPYRHTVSESGRPALVETMLGGSPHHWGWFEASQNPLAFQLDIKPETLSLEMSGTGKLPPALNLKEAEGTGNALNLIGKTSDFAALLPLSWASEFIPAEPSSLLLKTLRELADTTGTPTNALAFVALLDQNHNGRIRGPINKNLRGLIKGVKAPTLLLGMQIQSDAEADKRINQALTKLNSQFGMELTAGPFEPESGLRITSILDSQKSFYSAFEPEERVVYVVRGNWLIIASNGAILKRLLTEQNSEGRNDWKLDPAALPAASAWANLNGMGQTLKNATGVAKLATMLDSSNGSQEIRDKLDQAGTAAAVLRELGQANLSVNSAPTGFKLKLVIGERQ